jgi:hypothetical protein
MTIEICLKHHLFSHWQKVNAMFLRHKPSKNIVEILEVQELWNPSAEKVMGRFHAGEELQDPELFTKSHLSFPSEEPLPMCWLDSHYREHLQEYSNALSNRA